MQNTLCVDEDRFKIFDTHIELDLELVLEQLVYVPTLAEPARAVLVRLEAEPVVVRLFVVLHVLPEKKRMMVSAAFHSKSHFKTQEIGMEGLRLGGGDWTFQPVIRQSSL